MNEPIDYEQVTAAVNEQIRQQYGRHHLVRAADGGCRRCPLSAGDRIHFGAPRANPPEAADVQS